MLSLHFSHPHFRALRSAGVLIFSLQLCGCATLPSSGPTGAEIRRASDGRHGEVPFSIVELKSRAALPQEPDPAAVFTTGAARPHTDTIGVGDVLDIAIYEAGVSLFGTGIRAESVAEPPLPTAQAQHLPPMRVDDSGNIRIPFAGQIRVAGRTTVQVETAIRQALQGLSQDPQVLVTLREVVTNTVLMAGEISKPGRLVLVTNSETLSDAIALAGSYRGQPKDLAVRVERAGISADLRLSDVLAGVSADFRLLPGDKITIVSAPRTFSVLGASNKIEQFTFSAPSVTLAEAIAQAGGANPNTGDPKAIFVFRLNPGDPSVGPAVIYHLNLMEPGAYFLAQQFMMRDKDVLYVGNAEANQPAKLVQIIGQLFTPIFLLNQVAQ